MAVKTELKRLQFRLMKKSITLMLRRLYSETVAIHSVFNIIESNKAPVRWLPYYIAIITAAQLREPLTARDITDAVTKSLCAEHSKDFLCESDFATVIHLHRELAEICWLHKSTIILKGKLASFRYKNEESCADLFAYDAGVYESERCRKGPISQQLHDECKHLSSQIQKAQAALDKHLDENPSREVRDEAHESRQRRIQLLKETEEVEARWNSDNLKFTEVKASVESRLNELDNMASNEALDRSIKAMVKEAEENKLREIMEGEQTASSGASEEYGSRNKNVTTEMADEARAWIRAWFAKEKRE